MSCCDPNQTVWNGKDFHRRSVLKGAAALAGALAATPVRAATKSIKLAFCSQLLCIIPYEVARSHGHFTKEGLEVELVYARGGGAAMQALVGGAVDYGATALDNADHALCLFLLHEAGADATKVQFAAMGPNLLEALRQGQIDAGLVQEPALTLVVKAGGRVLVNAMDAADAKKYLGGNYEFMGVAVRSVEIPQRQAEMQALARALAAALQAVQTLSPDDLVKSLPPEMTTGADTGEMRDTLAKYRGSLYPTTVKIDLAAAGRVARSLKVAGLLKADADTSGLYDTSIAG